jgi:SAM-dependent methyltransferase
VSLFDYAGMLFRSERIEKFRSAIEASVKPGQRVLEVGTGLGTYAFFAARAGAGDVTAIESASVINVARTIAGTNGFDERIRFIRGKAPEELPAETFDLIIFEDFPTNFMDRATFGLLKQLQADHLAEGGHFLPGVARLCLAPVLTSFLGDETGDSGTDGAHAGRTFGLDWSELRALLANTGRKTFLTESAVAAAAHVGRPFPIIPVPGVHDLHLVAEWSDVEGEIGGVALWFDLDLGDGNWVSNAPSAVPEPWGQWLLPLDPPIRVDSTSPLKVRVWWEELEDGGPGWMGWEYTWADQIRRGHEFAGLPIESADLGFPTGRSEP